MPRTSAASLACVAITIAACATPGAAQVAATGAEPAANEANPYEGRRIDAVAFEGLLRVSEQYARNQLRTVEGRPLDWDVVREDLRRLERLGEFSSVQAEVRVSAGGGVRVIFQVAEAPIVRQIAVVGNRQVPDRDIAARVNEMVSLITGVPIDEFRIGQSVRAVEELYRERGFFQAEVGIDERELRENGVVLLRVREGERTKVMAIRFEGNASIDDRLLRQRIETKTPILFESAPVDDEVLDRDVAAIIERYRDDGFLDVRADRRVLLSPDAREAIVTFLIDEGPRYVLRSVELETTAGGAPRVFSPEQVRGLIEPKPGAFFGAQAASDAEEAVRRAYRRIGYTDARVGSRALRAIDEPAVDLRLFVEEGRRFRTGLVRIQGNTLTQAKVIRREVELKPDDWLDATAAEETERRLRNSGLFELDPRFGNPPKVTIQPEDPAHPGYRDVLVEVEETNTGRLSFGAAVSSDAGVVGAISLEQRNFDLFDTPDSFGELFRGRAFRGAGQTFNLAIQPGTEVSTYSVSLTEPNVFDSPYAATGAAFFREREFRDYDERRLGGRLRIARRFGTRWVGGVSFRGELIDLSDIDGDAPVDVFEVEDENTLTSVGLSLARTTVDNRFRPTRGTRTEIGVEQAGALGGDFDFTKLSVDHTVFFAIDRDEFGRATVASIKTSAGYIPQDDEAPIYERFYLGGRSFRGFDFRGVGPVGIRNDTGTEGNDQVGGDWLFFAGLEIEKPLWQDVFAGVVFVDTGTIADEIGFEDYRVSVGAGIRLYLPAFGQAPLAFDFGFPIVAETKDDEEVFSFSIDLPF